MCRTHDFVYTLVRDSAYTPVRDFVYNPVYDFVYGFVNAFFKPVRRTAVDLRDINH